MGKARNLSVLLAADGQVEDAKIDGVSSSKLSGALPAISAENLTSIPAGELTGTISDSRLSTASQAAKLQLSGGAMTGAITTNSTFDGRDVATDGTKLDTIETSATADQTGAQIKTAYEAETSAFTDAQFTKLSGIEASADVTDATNVNAAGALMLSDTTTAGLGIVIDEDNMSSDLSTKVPTQQSVKAYVDAEVASKDALSELSGTLDDITDGTTYKRMSATEQTKLSGIVTSANLYVHPNHSGEVTSTADGATVIADNIVDEANLKISNSPSNGYFLSAQSGNTGGLTWAEVDALPSQSGNSGKFLTTDATNASWATVDALPSQSGNAGKYLTTDATNASWATLDTDANTTTKGLYEHTHTISSNYSMTSGNNALSAGPITINSGIEVTIPSGSTWVIA